MEMLPSLEQMVLRALAMLQQVPVLVLKQAVQRECLSAYLMLLSLSPSHKLQQHKAVQLLPQQTLFLPKAPKLDLG